MSEHDKIVSALLAYDARQSKKYYNRYALPQYLGALERAETDAANGSTLRQALVTNFSDRLLDTVLKAIGEAPASLNELHYGRE